MISAANEFTEGVASMTTVDRPSRRKPFSLYGNLLFILALLALFGWELLG
jgi:hypothetical protein